MKNFLKQLTISIRTLVWLAVFAQPAVLYAGSVTVDGTRLWVAPDNTRLVFDISDQTEYRLFTLDNPDRIVIDLKNTRWKPGTDTHLKSDGYIKGLRSAKKGKDLRLVIDADRKVNPKSFLLKPNENYGDRLVVDLFEKNNGPVKAVKTVHENNRGYRDVVVAIDPGHGGEDPGAIGNEHPRKDTSHWPLRVSCKKRLTSSVV